MYNPQLEEREDAGTPQVIDDIRKGIELYLWDNKVRSRDGAERVKQWIRDKGHVVKGENENNVITFVLYKDGRVFSSQVI